MSKKNRIETLTESIMGIVHQLGELQEEDRKKVEEKIHQFSVETERKLRITLYLTFTIALLMGILGTCWVIYLYMEYKIQSF